MAHPRLEEAIARLREGGDWVLADMLTPFQSIPGRNYPVFLSCQGTSQGPAEVADLLAPAYLPGEPG